jgi:DMSO/TMAO reductase YedYZ molybdopterin-dependent catalytic subunit
LHEPRTAALVGTSVGVAFTVCFVTGVLSHLIQQPPSWFTWPARPAGSYRISQGIHTITGFVSIPLLLAKLWIVYPKLFEWPPVRSVVNALERLSLIPLIGGGLFMLMSGTANVARWYPWTFFFPTAHYWVAWVTFGALVIHLGAKWTIVRAQVGTGGRRGATLPGARPRLDDLEPARRNFLAGLTATGAVVFLAVAGNTIRPLSRAAILAQRRPGTGPQGIPINKSAKGAGVVEAAASPTYRLTVEGKVDRRLELSLDELRAMPQRSATLPIACVEGWSSSGTWTGVPMRDLLRAAGAAAGASVSVESFQRGGLYRRADVNADQAADADTLLALQLNGEPLHIDHGYPVRLIGPNRPGVLQTKWVERLVVS